MTMSSNPLTVALDKVAQDTMPTYQFPYLINSTQLMTSPNSLLKEAQKDNKYKSKLVLKGHETPKQNLNQLHLDTKRNVRISNENVGKLTQEQIKELVQKTFGDKHAENILNHYSQLVSYIVYNPILAYFVDPDDPYKDYMIKRKDDLQHENIYLYDNIPLRTIEIASMWLQIPQDENFMQKGKLEQKEKAVGREKSEEKAVGGQDDELDEKEITQNITAEQIKQGIENDWRGWWKYKFNCKLVTRATEDGFQILGIGTDDPLMACMYLGTDNAKQLFHDMINATLQVQVDAEAFLKKLEGKLAKAPESKAIQSKIVTMKKVLEKVDSFKNGELTFTQFVKAINDLHQISLEIEHTGPLSAPINKSLHFLGLQKASGTSVAIQSSAKELEKVLNNMKNSSAATLRVSLEDTSKDVDFKGNLHGVKEVILKYQSTRDQNLSLFTQAFDKERGNIRATSYINLLEQSQTPLGEAIVISAILNGKGTQMKEAVINSFSGQNEKEIKENLLKIIKTSLPTEILQKSALELVDNITKKAESNKKDINFKDEVITISRFEIGTTPPRLG
jgi:hypothetical protein